jgi:hypothetical protein
MISLLLNYDVSVFALIYIFPFIEHAHLDISQIYLFALMATLKISFSEIKKNQSYQLLNVCNLTRGINKNGSINFNGVFYITLSFIIF